MRSLYLYSSTVPRRFLCSFEVDKKTKVKSGFFSIPVLLVLKENNVMVVSFHFITVESYLNCFLFYFNAFILFVWNWLLMSLLKIFVGFKRVDFDCIIIIVWALNTVTAFASFPQQTKTIYIISISIQIVIKIKKLNIELFSISHREVSSHYGELMFT